MRRGQLTIWVVLGIAIVLGLILYILFFGIEKQEPPLPTDFEKVETHVQSCLRDTTVDALKRMAMHGGYLDPLDAAETGRKLAFNPAQPTTSEMIQLNPADPTSVVPYYYYLAGPNNCQLCLLTTLTPTKEQMEAQARKYVLAHLGECLDYTQFPDITIIEEPKQDVTVTLLNDSVEVIYKRVTAMEKAGTTAKRKEFTEKIPLPYLRYYQTAIAITQKEIDTQFLENYLMYLVSAYSGMNTPLPPLAGYDESFSPKSWVLYSAQEQYQDILYSTTPSLQVLRTQGVVPPPETDDPFVKGFFRMTYLDLLNETRFDTSKMRVSIFYPDYPLYLDVNPRAGQLIKPRTEKQGGIFLIPPRQQNYYDFYYDISAPFLVEIRQENALPGTDISFLFALEGNVRENKNMAQWLLGRGTIPWSNDFVELQVTDPASQSSDPAAKPVAQPYQHNGSVKAMLCDPTQKTAPLTVRTFDTRNDEPLSEVSLSYGCGYYATCGLGVTAPDAENIYAIYDEQVPQCIGGLLTAEKAGYATLVKRIDTRDDVSTVLDIGLDPFTTKKVKVVKYQLTLKPGGLGFNIAGPTPLEPSDKVFVMFNRQEQQYGESPVTASVIFDNTTPAIGEVLLIPGLYEVQATYFSGTSKTIRKGAEEAEDQPIPPEDLVLDPPLPWGGLALTNSTRLWQAERSMLYEENILVIPVFVAPEPRVIGDLDWMGAEVKFTRLFREQATPTYE